MPLQDLERVVPEAPGKPRRTGASENQAFARTIALQPDSWTRGNAEEMAARFDELAATWDQGRGHYRLAPLADALARGGAWPAGMCVEVGSGTGLLTPLLREKWNPVLGVDISHGMLSRSQEPGRVQADASRLPLEGHTAAVVAIEDAPLFASEVIRVLREDGVVLWVNALGRDAPFFVDPECLLAALRAASDGAAWSGSASEALWGSWAVLSRT